jgi:hypothetical protein
VDGRTRAALPDPDAKLIAVRFELRDGVADHGLAPTWRSVTLGRRLPVCCPRPPGLQQLSAARNQRFDMEAIRETVDVIDNTVTLTLPAGFLARRVEVIVLPAANQASATQPTLRQPSALLVGTKIIGDIMAPAVDAGEWKALQ